MQPSTTILHWVGVSLVAIVMAGTAAAQQQPADLVVTNAKVITVDAQRPQATAFAVTDGTFVAVGNDAEMAAQRGAQTRAIDAGGHTIIPGLNDSHAHVVRGGRFYHLELRWDGVDSLARGLAMIREQAKRTPKGQWVRIIGGWSPYQFKEKRMPTITELNEAAPDTPTFVLFLYSQGMLNREAVQALGLTEDTKAPEDGRYEFVDGGAILHAEPNPAILYAMIAKPPQLSAEDQMNSTPSFERLRQDEDWSTLCDPARRVLWFDAIKCVPLDVGRAAWLSIGGEVRERYEYTHNPLWGQDPKTSTASCSNVTCSMATGICAHSFPGAFVKQTGPAKDINFLEITLTAQL